MAPRARLPRGEQLIPRIALVTLLVALVIPAGSGAPTEDCAQPGYVAMLGPVCAVAGGFEIAAPDGTTLFTHGPDPIPTLPRVAPPALPDPGVACVPESEPHIRVVYAFPRGVTQDQALFASAVTGPQILDGVLQANAIVYHNAMAHGVPIRWKMLCDEAGLPAIDIVVFDTPASEASFWSIAVDLWELGYTNADEKVLVFYDGTVPCGGCGGTSFVPGGDEASPDNANNFGWWSISAVYIDNYGTPALWALDEVILHEETHAMGGVQNSAPNASGGYHCNDGWDIMCYSDGGPTSDYGENCQPLGYSYAGLLQPYDCGSEDYFHPTPAPGSYLDTHWNVGGAYNRFLARG